MPRTRTSEIEGLLDRAEAAGTCLSVRESSLRRALRRRVLEGKLASPLPGLFARARLWDALPPTKRTLWTMRGLARLRPGLVFCGPSAAVAHGLEVPDRAQRRVHVAVPEGRHATRCPVARHIETVRPVMASGVRATPLVRTTFDCMRWLGLRNGLVVADSALRDGGLSKETLQRYVSSMRTGFHGAAQARLTASLADARSENGGESIARAIMYELGFASPELQVEVRDPTGCGRPYRVDYCWRLPDGRLTYGELDGDEKYRNPAMTGPGGTLGALRAERRRESRITVGRVAILRFSLEEALDVVGFVRLLELFGVPRDHAPLIDARPPVEEVVPVEAYGLP